MKLKKDVKESVKKNGKKMSELIEKKPDFFKLPKAGDNIEGEVIEVGKKEILVSLPGLGIGIVRGPELPDRNQSIKAKDKVLVTVLELENEAGILELSLKQASEELAWRQIQDWKESGEIVTVKISQANKGGLIANIVGVPGFLPVSQLAPANYPRVEGGDKSEIIRRLNILVGKELKVKVIDSSEEDNKLSVSEKAASAERDKEKLTKLKIGSRVEGIVSGLADFGIFVKFDDLEGLVHVSEMAWHRVANPRELFQMGDKITAEVIGITNGRISLSIKNLKPDPWLTKAQKYEVNQIVEGEIIKISPFGAFVKLDEDIHGLLHSSELDSTLIKSPLKVGDKKNFKIISIEPKEHRLGLSLAKEVVKVEKSKKKKS